MPQDKGSWMPDCRKNCLYYKRKIAETDQLTLCKHKFNREMNIWYPPDERWFCHLYENRNIDTTTTDMNQLFKQGIEQLAKGRNDILFGLKNLHFENIMTNEGQDIWKQMERFIQKTEDAFRRLEEEYGELK